MRKEAEPTDVGTSRRGYWSSRRNAQIAKQPAISASAVPGEEVHASAGAAASSSIMSTTAHREHGHPNSV